MIVIPSVNCIDKECVEGKIRAAEKFADWVHLDVADGCFTYNKTWERAEEWSDFNTKLWLEVHLMVEHPDKVIERWLKAGAKRIIVHAEALNAEKLKIVNDLAKKYGAELMLASNPETMVDCLPAYLNEFNKFQVLAVNPGLAGQKFLPLVLGKIKYLRKHFPSSLIEVDGGIDEETAKLVKSAGADVLVTASYLFGSDEPHKAYEKLALL